MRLLKDTPGVVSVLFTDDETVLTPTGPVTVTVTRADGSAVTSGTATTLTGLHSFTVAPQAVLGLLTLRWAGTFNGLARSKTTYLEIVGSRIFELMELRDFDDAIDTVKFPTAALNAVRERVEDEFERITRWCFIYRAVRIVIPAAGADTIMLPVRMPRAVTAIKDGSTVLAVSTVDVDIDGAVMLNNGRTFAGKVTVDFEYGMDVTPVDVKDAAIFYARYRLFADRLSNVPDRAESFTATEGGTYRLAVAGRSGYETGLPEVDAILSRYNLKVPGY